MGADSRLLDVCKDMTDNGPSQLKLMTRLEEAGFIKNATIGSSFVYERAHPNEPKLRVVVDLRIRFYSDPLTSVSISTVLFTPHRDYTIAYPFTVRVPKNEDDAWATVARSIAVAHNRGCVWYDKKNGTDTASGEVTPPKMGGYQKMECRKTPLDKL